MARLSSHAARLGTARRDRPRLGAAWPGAAPLPSHMARRGWARRGSARRGLAWQDEARPGRAWFPSDRGTAWHGVVWHGVARRGLAPHGEARRGVARLGSPRLGTACVAWRVWAWRRRTGPGSGSAGRVRRGKAGLGSSDLGVAGRGAVWPGLARFGMARHGAAGQGYLMSAQPQTELTGARWSSAVHCPRRAYYDHVDAPKSEPSEQMRRWWRRGHAVQAAIQGAIFADLREQNRRPRAEELVPWPAADPIGTGHLDAYIPHEQHALEIKSNGHAELTAAAALQVSGYCLNHPNAEHATVISVDSNTFEERWFPIDVRGLEAEVREIEEKVSHGCRTGSPPDRVCRHPHDTEAFLCSYAEHCFEGWVRPDRDVSFLDEEAIVLAELTDDVGRARRAVAAAEEARDAHRETLRPYLELGVELETPSIQKLQVTEIAARETLSLSDLKKAGVSLPRKLRPFVKVGQPSERWTIRRRESL